MKNFKNIKIAYIGGGSRLWARTFMNDIAIQDDFCGEVRLYDIDNLAAQDNKIIGEIFNNNENAKSKWNYIVSKDLKEALTGADFVLVSIQPGTFDEMENDVHIPEKYGIFQSVGDSAGPGGIIRAMRTIPMYEVIALAIKNYCKNAWVINFTNPMTLCTSAFYDVFPEIKAFGCCHEVFGTQNFLIKVVKDILGVDALRNEIKVEVQGVNHFTFITRAEYKDYDLFEVLKEYIKKYNLGKQEFKEENIDYLSYIKENCWASKENVKCDFFNRYNQLGGAGDRHLAEFVNNSWYLKDAKTIYNFGFGLTTVKWRKNDLKIRLEKTKNIISGKEKIVITKPYEEFTQLISAILGIGDFVSNVNLPNMGQLDFAPKGAVVETNAVFSKNSVKPVCGLTPLNQELQPLVIRMVYQQENILRAIRERDLNKLFNSFMNEPLCSTLSFEKGKMLFKEMINNTKKYLEDWNLDF